VRARRVLVAHAMSLVARIELATDDAIHLNDGSMAA
jgi:hypothetical protein